MLDVPAAPVASFAEANAKSSNVTPVVKASTLSAYPVAGARLAMSLALYVH
jgi:hypothetical protein